MKRVIWLITGIVLLVLVLMMWPFATVAPDERGLVLTWGAVSDKVLGQGTHFRIPVAQHVETISIAPQQLDLDIPVDGSGAITKDNQTIGAQLVLFYRFDEARLVEMRKNYGIERIESLLRSSLRESLKEVIGEYDIFEVATRQAEIRTKVLEKLAGKSKEYPAQLTELRVSNYDWSDAFDAQINATMLAAQQVKKAEQELLLTEQQAQKKVKEAEAEKAALITTAEGEKEAAKLNAEARALKGNGERQYNEALRATLDIEIRLRELQIEQTRAERWNGQNVPEQYFTPLPFTSK